MALQVGGCNYSDLAKAAKLAQAHGYDEVNLNCGCPSEKVLAGSFGACLMREPHKVFPPLFDQTVHEHHMFRQ